MNWSVNPFRTNSGGALRTGLVNSSVFYFFERVVDKQFFAMLQYGRTKGI